ncbi:MAG: proliferating cell nuclear antigen (pcna) [Candidatus ainarchaeum sp.]|nr:proliferating cell nuclear antigen (pcna) [Candidatus ainarchaeum sp.]
MIIEEAPFLKSAIDSIVSLVEEGVFEITEEGIKFKAMDPSQISMISFSMEKKSFESFEIDENRAIGLDITQFSNVLSRGKKGEKAELSLEDGRMVIKFLGDKKSKTFKIPLLELSSGMQKEPPITYTNHVKINADAFKESLKDAKLISSHVKLSINPDDFIVEVKGESGHLKDEFHKDSAEVIEIKTSSKEGARATFPLQYLEDIVKASLSSTEITIFLETDKPLKISYELSGAKIVYYLAPRIEND